MMGPTACASPSPSRRFWTFGASIESGESQAVLSSMTPPRLNVVNALERIQFWNERLATAPCEERYGEDSLRLGADVFLPTPILEITAPYFAPNYVYTHGVQFVSQRLRDAMRLPPETVTWRPVDMGRSSERAKAADYREMHLLASLDVIDDARTDYDVLRVPCGDGLVDGRKMAKSIYWREDVDTPHDLFWARHSNIVVATDALATRVLEAGFDDVAFFDQQGMQERYDREGVSGEIIVKRL